MRQSFFSISLMFLFLFPGTGHAEPENYMLYKGKQELNVQALQNVLQSKGYLQHLEMTEYYDPATIKGFQRIKDLKAGGIADSDPLHAVKTLHTGLIGTSVKNLQEQLKDLGFYHYRVTGIYNVVTARAVMSFQRANDLQVDGIAGPNTLRKLRQYAGPLSSESENDSEMMKVVSTAYTAYCDGCSGVTKSGLDLRKYPDEKVVAVDPLTIPLGSKVYVPGYGAARALDIGSAIDGKEIDVFISSLDQALEWGRRAVWVKVEK